MRKKKLLAAAGMALAAAMAVTGCTAASPASSGSSAKHTPVVALITVAYATPAVKFGVDLFKAEAIKRGWKIEVTDTANDYNKLNALMQADVSRHVDAFVMGFTSQEQATLGIGAANAAHIPVFAIDAGVSPWKQYALNVTSDNTELATDSAQAIMDAHPGGGDILILGFDGHPGIRLRTTVATKLFTDKGYKIAQNYQIQAPANAQSEAQNFVQNYLQAHPGSQAPVGIWAGFDAVGVGAANAIEAAGAKGISVASMNGDAIAVAEMKKPGSPMVATVLQQWPTIIRDVLTGMDAFFADGSLPKTNYIEIKGSIINKQNMSKY